MSASDLGHVFPATPVLDRPATLEDVARLAGVSRQTVSNAVNSPHLLRAETLARVATAVDRLDYRPNAAARAMRTGQAGVLAVRVGARAGRTLSRALTAGEDFLPAFAEAARCRGRSVVGFAADDDVAEAARYTDLVAGLGLDGVLVEHGGDPCAAADSDARLRWLAARRVRGVLVGPGGGAGGGPLPRVDVDVEAGFRRATTALLDLGHRRIALLGPGAAGAADGGPADGAPANGPEQRGWAAAMTAAGRSADDLTVPAGDDLTAVRAAVARLLARTTRPSAVVCTSELGAAAAHAEITAWGLSVGEDVAIVGVGDGLALRALDVAVVAVPAADLAAACVDLLLRRTTVTGDADEPVAAPVVHLVPELHVRRSMDAPSGRGEA